MNPEGGGYGRSLLWGVLLGLAGVAALAGYLLYNASTSSYAGGVPEELLVVGGVQDAEGATVGGIVFILQPDGSVEYVDATQKVTIPGTSYETLQDAYAFGGGEAVAEAYGRLEGVEAPPWVALPQDTWMSVVDEANGVAVEVEEGVYVFLGKELVSLEEGEQELSGNEIAAYWAAAPYADNDFAAERVRTAVTEAVGAAMMSEWALVVEAVEGEKASSLVPAEYLQEYGGSFAQ